MLSQLFSALAARTWAVGVAAAVAVVAVANWVASALLVWAKVVVKGDDVLTATSDIGTLKGTLREVATTLEAQHKTMVSIQESLGKLQESVDKLQSRRGV